MVFRITGPVLFMILVLSGCALCSVRQDAFPQAPDQTTLPSSASFHYALGVLHALNENMEEAIREMEEARRLDPSSPYLAKEVASLYTEKGETEKALAISKKTLETHPNDIDTRLLLGGIYLNQKNYRSAAAEYQRVIDLDPKNLAALFYLGTSQAELKQFDDAVASFKELIRRDPDHFMANYYLARILADLQRYDEAEAAIQEDPGPQTPVRSGHDRSCLPVRKTEEDPRSD